VLYHLVFMKLRARLLQLLGIVVALAGLTGFWLTRDVERAVYTEETLSLINADEDDFKASFVIAGRDYDYTEAAGPCVKWQDGFCLERTRPGVARYGNRTDTMIYAQVVNDKVTMISIPRDIYLPQWQAKINDMYFYQGAEGLERSVEEITGLPIDYYVIINIDIFKDLVDALGGVEINVPYDMYYTDAAANLSINLKAGPQVLDGEQAAGFVRFRYSPRGDYDRIDNIKALAFAMLGKLKAMNVSAASKVPELIDVFIKNVETNASVTIIRQMLPRLSNLQLQTAILPTYHIEGTNREGYDPEQVASSLSQAFGGEVKTFITPPDAPLLITNNSGRAGLEERYKDRLIGMGVAAEAIVTRLGETDATPTRMLALAASWQDADYYTTLFGIGKQQKDSLPVIEDKQVMLELVLGTDAARNAIALEPVVLQSQR
jgi:polyisoprenyl-teichoic acid--peptidoglycan teichoic acid transferase